MQNLLPRGMALDKRFLGRNEFLDLRESYAKPVLWSRSYFAGSCGGAPLEIIKQYIQNQQG